MIVTEPVARLTRPTMAKPTAPLAIGQAFTRVHSAHSVSITPWLPSVADHRRWTAPAPDLMRLKSANPDARIAHTTFESNASGHAFDDPDTPTNEAPDPSRSSRLPNVPAVIYVSGATPTIVDNTFLSSVSDGGTPTATISINANALEEVAIKDLGRQTGNVDLVDHPQNFGPLIRGNRIEAKWLCGLAGSRRNFGDQCRL